MISDGMQYLSDKFLYDMFDSKYSFTTLTLNSVLYLQFKN